MTPNTERTETYMDLLLPIDERMDLPEEKPWFVYGTLLYPSVFDRVVGDGRENVIVRPGIAFNTRRIFVPGAWFPTLVKKENMSVGGRLIFGLDDDQLERLRMYEGGLYSEETMDIVSLFDTFEANVFIYKTPIEEAMHVDWVPGEA